MRHMFIFVLFFYKVVYINISQNMSHKKQSPAHRLKSCVLICQSLENDYDTTSPFSEVGNFAAIDYALCWLSQNNVQEVFLFYSTLKNQIEEYTKTVAKNVDLKLRHHFMKPNQLKSFGDVMREVRFRDLVSDDFLVMYADTLTNVNLAQLIDFHFQRKTELRNVVLTTAMRRGLSQNMLVVNGNTSEILQIQQNGKGFILNNEKVSLKKLNVDFRRDLVEAELFICTIEVLKGFKETEEHQHMKDFIIYQQKILVYELRQREIALRINKCYSTYLAYMNFICGYLYPYTLHFEERMNKINRNNDKVFTLGQFNKVYRRGVSINEQVKLSNNVYLGQNCTIEQGAVIEKSVIGRNVVIGRNANIKQCVILDGVKVDANSTYEYCLLENAGPTIKIHHFKSDLYEQPVALVSRELFQSTPEPEEVTFEQELKHVLDDGGNLEDETIVVSELVRMRKESNKSQGELTKDIVQLLAPKGIKGIESLTETWGSVLLKLHHEDQNQLIQSLFFACTSIPDYVKAFHLFLQYFYHLDIISKDKIIYWYKNNIDNDSPTINMCNAFVQKLQEESEEEEEEDEEES